MIRFWYGSGSPFAWRERMRARPAYERSYAPHWRKA
jgi:hypothetical protein